MAGSEHAFTWLSLVPGLNQLPDHTASALLVGAGLLGTAYIARRQLAAVADAALPDGRLSARDFYEVYVETFTGVAESIIGHDAKRYVPLYGSLFLFILFSNLLGLIPGFSPPTGSQYHARLGLLSFVMFNYYGLKAHDRVPEALHSRCLLSC
jgi:F-type H+-transporting ATPase subunit a